MVPGGTIAATLNGETEIAAIHADGSFSVTFDNTAMLGVVGSPFSVSFSYAGDSEFLEADDTSELSITAAATTTVLSASANYLTGGQSVTFTANVTANAPSTAVPTGSVDFFDRTTGKNLGKTSLPRVRVVDHLPTGHGQPHDRRHVQQ